MLFIPLPLIQRIPFITTTYNTTYSTATTTNILLLSMLTLLQLLLTTTVPFTPTLAASAKASTTTTITAPTIASRDNTCWTSPTVGRPMKRAYPVICDLADDDEQMNTYMELAFCWYPQPPTLFSRSPFLWMSTVYRPSYWMSPCIVDIPGAILSMLKQLIGWCMGAPPGGLSGCSVPALPS